jgi:lipopolysaccharide/colanic/teichoic acid biosynthesis glycosyltransferase
MEQITNVELEIDKTIKPITVVQTPFTLKTLNSAQGLLVGIVWLIFNFGLVYGAFALSYYLRFQWLNFDHIQLEPDEVRKYLDLGGVYSLITLVILILTRIFLPTYKNNFIRAIISVAGVVLTSVVIIALIQLMGQPAASLSRRVFALVMPLSWLVLIAELLLVAFIGSVVNTFNIRHYNLITYAISLNQQTLLALENRSRSAFVVKRAVDIVGAVIILLLAAIPVVLITIAVKLDSKGPVIFRQTRVGKNGRHFTLFKFRSMYIDADARLDQLIQFNETRGVTFKMKNDPRITRVGRFLRRTSLDELPQLVNVLMGQMSLVGPRPGLPREVINYQAWQYRRLEVIPGLTGLWQVSGRSAIGFEEMTKLDIYYMYRWSLWMDLKILVKTVTTVLSGRGAY